ncbi:Lrp/AsnC family transcriptional regulator [Sphingobium sp. LMA1-1-1.1]|uniref:Lrp/AsnC family transcriptional regulator n=1 Tax=unclassified Sphingobium TaxID=2611147 RepID=UPI003435590B
MDRLDRKILSALQQFPEMSVVDIASHVGLSHTPCWRRIKKLEEMGAIRGKVVLLDAQLLGLTVDVFAQLKLKQHDEETLNRFETAVRDRSEIVECFSMSGDSDYLIRIVIDSIASYETFLKKVLLHLPGVGSINSNFALGCVKMTTNLPITS